MASIGNRDSMNAWKQLRAILLPGVATIVVPAIILCFTGTKILARPLPWIFVLPVAGLVLMCAGLLLMVKTNRLFITVGRGTLAPWNPTQKLVVRGVYRHVRNPMIVGVFCILSGESVIFGSLPLFGWFGVFCVANMLYIPLLEEPGQARRFGDDYLLYRKNVPRWIPRSEPWDELTEGPTSNHGGSMPERR